MTSSIISLRDINFQYNQTTILQNINLEIKPKDKILITGESGAGKTTLLHIMGKILTPTAGQVIHNGSVNFIFQFHHLLSTLTAFENIHIPLTISGDSSAAEKTQEILKQIGMEHRATHMPPQLSGGEKQRIAIGRAIALNPECILCDEPTGSLDEERSTSILNLLLEMAKNTAIVIISHDLSISKLVKTHLHLSSHTLQPAK